MITENDKQVTVAIRFVLCSKHMLDWDTIGKPWGAIEVISEVRACDSCEPFDFEEEIAYRPRGYPQEEE